MRTNSRYRHFHYQFAACRHAMCLTLSQADSTMFSVKTEEVSRSHQSRRRMPVQKPAEMLASGPTALGPLSCFVTAEEMRDAPSHYLRAFRCGAVRSGVKVA